MGCSRPEAGQNGCSKGRGVSAEGAGPATGAPGEDRALIEQLRRLEHASRPLDPGASRRRALRTGVLAYAERFLRRIRDLKAFTETPDQGIGLLDSPIGERGMALSEALALLWHTV